MEISIGIQVYTVRDDCKRDFKGTLSALAKMGYQGVELGGDYYHADMQRIGEKVAAMRILDESPQMAVVTKTGA